MEKIGTYGVFFMKGAFHFKFEWLGEDLIARPIHSKNIKKVDMVEGIYKSWKELMDSSKSEKVKKIIDSKDFDFIIMGHGKSVSYYLNTPEGIIYCDLTVYKK